MKIRIAAIVIFLSTIAPFPVGAIATSSEHSGVKAPELSWTTVAGYRFAVAGSSWGHSSRVTFRLRQGFPGHETYPIEGLELKTTKDGSFVVGISNIDLCNGENFTARDFKGHRVEIIGPIMNCLPSPTPPIPQLNVTTGAVPDITVTHVDRLWDRKPIVIRLGDAIYLWEKGVQHPFWIPSAPSPSLALIGRGLTPPRRCNQVECAAGFFWEWVGMKLGQTSISMDPWCRTERPACGVPSFLLQVRITPALGAGRVS